jgi:hypothetical protein
MPNHPQRDPIRSHQRKAIAARRVGENAQCVCGEKRPEALISGSTPIICARCQRSSKGQSIMDKHHVAGRANSPVTIPIPVNDHRAILSVDQQNWPAETLENPEQLETLKIAGTIRGLTRFLEYLIDKVLRPVPERLEELAKLERQNRRSEPLCQKTKHRTSYR